MIIIVTVKVIIITKITIIVIKIVITTIAAIIIAIIISYYFVKSVGYPKIVSSRTWPKTSLSKMQ